jgi:hypothetical protein
MSFGWSASDIGVAIKFIYHVYEALDDCHGAPKDYRETLTFLRDLVRTLLPLETFSGWGAFPSYGDQITEQANHIKGPVQKFLEETLKYEPSLGAEAKEGHFRNVRRKLQWHFVVSRKVLDLKRKIRGHTQILDSLVQRLILYVPMPNYFYRG